MYIVIDRLEDLAPQLIFQDLHYLMEFLQLIYYYFKNKIHILFRYDGIMKIKYFFV